MLIGNKKYEFMAVSYDIMYLPNYNMYPVLLELKLADRQTQSAQYALILCTSCKASTISSIDIMHIVIHSTANKGSQEYIYYSAQRSKTFLLGFIAYSP